MSTVDVEVTIQRKQRRNTRQSGQAGKEDVAFRIPRITRLMALAIKFQEMIDRGEVRDYADIARLGYVTRARITQIMNLLNLAPDLQELLLAGPSGVVLKERHIRCITQCVSWNEQRRALNAPVPGALGVAARGTLRSRPVPRCPGRGRPAVRPLSARQTGRRPMRGEGTAHSARSRSDGRAETGGSHRP